jgi:hypothetical protein
MSGAPRDAQGCLTPEGFRALEQAPVGRGPAELADHLSRCSRCQNRFLSGFKETPRRIGRTPSLWGAFIALGIALLLTLLALVAAHRFAGS